VAFQRILRRIAEAERSIEMRCFDWRDDDTGAAVGRALLAAADRGVSVTIHKDRVGMHYEYLEDTKQSFFHKRVALVPRVQTWFLMAVYGQRGSLRQKASRLAARLLRHPNVTVHRDQKRFDHAKLYVFDERSVILGGMGIGDDFRLRNVDFMVEVSGGDAAARLRDRYEGRAAFDSRRSFDYLLYSFRGSALVDDSLAEQRLALIDGARKRLTIEMAYMGERRCTDALVAAVKRGVEVTLLTAEKANVLGDLNRYTCDQLLRRTGSPENLRIVLHPRMVHGKAMVVDRRIVDIGSANFTVLSHGGYEEVDLYCRDPLFASDVEDAIEEEIEQGMQVAGRVPFRRSYVMAERVFAAYQAKTAISLARRKTKPIAERRARARGAQQSNDNTSPLSSC
jgi:cardiolipin synthase A/B